MKKLNLNSMENTQGGDLCGAAVSTSVVTALGDAAATAGWLALNPAGAGILAFATVGLALFGAYCYYRD